MILFVDDEVRHTASYRQELELALPHYDVVFHSDVDKALHFFEANVDQIELLILDIMMLPGRSFEGQDTMLGLRTGLRFYEKVRQARPTLPVIISTNVMDPKVEEYFSKESWCVFLRKDDYFPSEFAEEVEKALERT